jgi:hypothetical protein
MRFANLDGLQQPVSGVYTVAWRIIDNPDDPWTTRLIQFKTGNAAAITGARRLLITALGALLEKQRWNPAFSGLTVALHSQDRGVIAEKPLPVIASRCAAFLGMPWLPNLLSKQPHRPLHRLSGAANRLEELQNTNYRAAPFHDAKLRRVLVLDDLITRGDTLSAIAGAIQATSPALGVHGIALGKNERERYAAQFGYMIRNDHVPGDWAARWDRA